MKEYKIVFPRSRKMWTSDLSLIKNYSKILKEDSFSLYSQSSLLIRDKGGDENTFETFSLDEWLKNN